MRDAAESFRQLGRKEDPAKYIRYSSPNVTLDLGVGDAEMMTPTRRLDS